MAGRLALAWGTRRTCAVALGFALAGLVLLLPMSLSAVLTGLVMVSVGTFFAQATATGFVGRAATADRAAASGLYLASYFLGGLVGSAVSGQIFDQFGWPATVAAVAVSLAAAMGLTVALRIRR
jgi:predicted MFS family arabinose efflux permease